MTASDWQVKRLKGFTERVQTCSNYPVKLFMPNNLEEVRACSGCTSSYNRVASTEESALKYTIEQQKVHEKFGRSIREFRLAQNLTQEELASRAGVHRTYISEVERGTRGFSFLVLFALASALNVNLSKIAQTAEKL